MNPGLQVYLHPVGVHAAGSQACWGLVAPAMEAPDISRKGFWGRGTGHAYILLFTEGDGLDSAQWVLYKQKQSLVLPWPSSSRKQDSRDSALGSRAAASPSVLLARAHSPLRSHALCAPRLLAGLGEETHKSGSTWAGRRKTWGETFQWRLADAFFALFSAVLAFARSVFLLRTLETPSDLPGSAGNLQSFINISIFCNISSMLPCCLRYRLSPSVLSQHLAQGGPALSWPFAFQNI